MDSGSLGIAAAPIVRMPVVSVGPLYPFGRLAPSLQYPRQSYFGDIEYIRGYSCTVTLV